MTSSEGPTLVYDGDCPRCTQAASWLARRARVATVPWQAVADLGSLGLTRREVDQSVWWVDAGGRRGGVAAVSRALRAAGGPWPAVAWLLDRPPLRWLAAAGYRVFARHRRRVPTR